MQVFGVGGGGSNAVNNMVNGDVQGVELWVANTDSQVGDQHDLSTHSLLSKHDCCDSTTYKRDLINGF